MQPRRMDREALRDLWEQNKSRPAFVREHREEIHEHTDTSDPIPDSESLAEVRDWLASYKGTVTKQLRAGDSTNTDDDEGGA